jgi:hypothetical protein
MTHRFFSFLYGGSAAEFESAFTLKESVERLSLAIVKSTSFGPLKPAAVGTVTAGKVSLVRVVPMVRNSFKPYFIGHFEVRGERVVLTGRFTMHWFVKLFMTFWFGFILLWLLLTSAIVLHQPHAQTWWFSLSALSMLMFGVALVRFCKYLSHNDISWLSEIIKHALT